MTRSYRQKFEPVSVQKGKKKKSKDSNLKSPYLAPRRKNLSGGSRFFVALSAHLGKECDLFCFLFSPPIGISTKVFSKIDLSHLTDAYYRIWNRDDEWKTAFMDIMNSMWCLWDLPIRPLLFKVTWIEPFEDLCRHLEQVMERLRQKKCSSSKPKSSFWVFLQWTWLVFGWTRTSEDNHWMEETSSPDVSRYRAFIGFCNFYRRFIHN
jgi:hypothetical protein